MAGLLIILLVGIIVGVMFVKYDSRDKDGWEPFFIKEGSHYSVRSNRPFPIPFKLALHSGALRFTAMFGEGCDKTYTANWDSINKLYGVSYGVDPHYRSVRVGWRYNPIKEEIELFVYAYSKGIRQAPKYLFSVQLHEEAHFTMFRTKNNIVVVEGRPEGGKVVTEAVAGIDKPAIAFKLWPYFGGKYPAPKSMKIFIRCNS